MQCDEAHPICRLCAVSERGCSYSSNAPASGEQHAILAPSRLYLSNPAQPNGETVLDFNSAAPLTPTSNASSSGYPLNYNRYDATSDTALNFDHMELLVHATQDSDLFSLGTAVGGYHSPGLALALNEALKAPYLMHALLAFSAQHLAVLHPGRSSHYLHQATSLQTRAISLFNTSWTQVDESNCVAALLFSTVLGHQILADALRKRDPGGLDVFIRHYVQCVEMHRGIYTIASSTWPLLMQSGLGPILTLSRAFTSQPPVGHECDSLKDLVVGTKNLSQTQKDACLEVVRYLQVGLDAVANTHVESRNRHQMICSLTMLIPSEVNDMLAKKQPEALILLAYYAVLLYHGRELWQTRDAGVFIFGLVAGYLGDDLEPWMKYPREVMFGGRLT